MWCDITTGLLQRKRVDGKGNRTGERRGEGEKEKYRGRGMEGGQRREWEEGPTTAKYG